MSAEPSPDILDLAALRRNFGDDLAFAARLAVKFELRYPAQMVAIVDAIEQRDGNSAAEAAHRLAGETSVFYAVAARQTALGIEDFSRAGDFTNAEAACERLRIEMDRLVRALRDLQFD